MNPFVSQLLAWYDRSAVQLDWRETAETRDSAHAYRVWLSEMMLQQTQVETVKPYFARFLATYPTVHDLAAAQLDEVLKLWEGLGYYSRARNLHRCARIVVRDYQGQFPATVGELLKLPGIGRYTAGAIASIAYDVRAPVLDGNVIRIYSRLLDLSEDVALPATKAKLWAQAEAWLPDTRAGDYNQALMDLGRLICKPRQPLCERCPIQAHCLAYTNDTQEERPVKTRKAAVPHYDVTAGMIWNERSELLIAQRPLDGLLGGLWEFPGGKREASESLPACLQRELREELAIEVEVGDKFAVVKHGFTHFRITLHAFTCRYLPESGAPQALGVQAWAWVLPEQLDGYAFGKADRQVIAALKARKDMLL
jgi:A/G-specific adenine glycosylase